MTDQELIGYLNKLDQKIDGLREESLQTRVVLEEEIRQTREENRQTRTALEEEIRQTRTALEEEIRQTRAASEQENRQTRTALEEEIRQTREENRQTRTALEEEIRQTRAASEQENRQTRVMLEGLRSEVQLLAEGVIGQGESFAIRHTEILEKLGEVKALVGPLYQDLNRRVKVLEERAERQTRDVIDVIRERFGKH